MSCFKEIGLYVWEDNVKQHPFWKACGVNVLQFCDLSWYRRAPDIRDVYLQKTAQEIQTAHQDGFSVYIILFANIQQWEGTQEICDSPIGYKFHPEDTAAMEKRLADLRLVIQTLKQADGFTFFAGDPGGVPHELGQGNAEQWISMARRVKELVNKEAPHADFHINPWAVTMWQYPLLPCEDVAWWQKETELTQHILQTPHLFGPNCGIELPCHNYYRAMSLRLFSLAKQVPDQIPSVTDVQQLKAQNISHIWGWPYFLLDEADDGDVGPDGSINPLPQSETRYIYRFVSQMRAIGLDGLIGNWSYSGHKAKALNTYAFGRFCQDATATPASVIKEFACGIATDDTAETLEKIFRFIENQSNWQKKLPEEQRLPDFTNTFSNGKEAMEAFLTVTARSENFPFDTAEPPAEFLQRVHLRLQQLL